MGDRHPRKTREVNGAFRRPVSYGWWTLRINVVCSCSTDLENFTMEHLDGHMHELPSVSAKNISSRYKVA